MKVAVLVSGNGTNLQALVEAGIPVGLVVSDRRSAYALERARTLGLPTRVIRPKDFPTRDAFDEALAEALEGADLVVHAGFLRIVGPRYLARWEGRAINVHPSLLPAFPGLRAPEQAIAYGVRVSGATVHFVDAGVDTGPIILQEAVPVFPDDTPETLHARIQKVEWRILPQAARLFLEGRLRIEGRRVRILGEA
jgi:phosphoribosylglycinamide formyltransferase-1